ncbi:YqhG family protein [Paenibacillus sp. KQZ6P-2]|uniref:YqhG family protein n=1 Tax=Paenibacillus mangrovi TaxID=2931978 RepID=A0A9X2B0N7_9BACL|nr:YqhG family protein [Paenibacillus mangrovi]MCJ8010411.1 YqhG family protein [Paenibacillus mangrovi]
MSMSQQQVQEHMMTYLESTECRIIEKSPWHVTVKLSPQADKQLTNRPYYWGFVERTGVEPETLSFTFVFDPEQYDKKEQLNASQQPQQDSILSRYFGTAPMVPQIGPGRIQREDVVYGSSRLQQIWNAARQEGSCLYLFEQPAALQRETLFSAAYEPWLGICYKVEMACDVKKEELHFVGISLVTGRIVSPFPERLRGLALSPRLPENIHIQPASISLPQAASLLEGYMTRLLAEMDYGWAEQARERLNEELAVIDIYYEDLLKEPDEEKLAAIREQYSNRRSETTWQYEPKVHLSVITCGLFHLRSIR